MAEPRSKRDTCKAERDALRERLLAIGASRETIKNEMVRSFRYRPRAAWRHAYGWSQETLAERFNAEHDLAGRAPMSQPRIASYERWPHSGKRPTLEVLRALASLFGTSMEHVVDSDDLEHMPEAERTVVTAGALQPNPELISPTPPITAYGDWGEPVITDDPVRAVVMAAHEGSEHAERTERRDIGEATLEQLRDDVARLSAELMTADPFPVFQEMRKVRSRIYTALERRVWTRDQAELYFLLGALHCLMANTADFLGHPEAASELVRAGWAYAMVIDHNPLKAQLRLHLSSIAYWYRPRQSRDLARSGLGYLPSGPGAVQLHLQYGRAAARLGDSESARRAIAAAHDARDRDHHDELLELGGEFVVSLATQHWLAGGALIEVPGAEHEAISELEQAVALYSAGPRPGEQHSAYCAAIAHIDLATAQLRDGQLEAATDTLQPVLALPSNRRIDPLPQRFGRVRTELAAGRYSGNTLAQDTDEIIEAFCSETIVADLRELPASPR